MTHHISCLFGTTALAAILSLPAAAQEYSNGGKGAAGRGPATMTPVEAYGVHPPGLAPADARHWKPYVPYYAPLSPVASSTRWRPWANYFLLPYYTPYYIGYSPNRHWNPPPRPYGSNPWGRGPMPEMPLPEEPGTTPLNYAAYTSVIDDDTIYWNMGGNGLVPYGEPPPATARPADLVDAIQASRPRGRRRWHFLPTAPVEGPAIEPPTEDASEREPQEGRNPAGTSHRRRKPAEPIAPGPMSQEPENGSGSDRSGS